MMINIDYQGALFPNIVQSAQSLSIGTVNSEKLYFQRFVSVLDELEGGYP